MMVLKEPVGTRTCVTVYWQVVDGRQIVVRCLARAGSGIQIGRGNAPYRGWRCPRADEVLIADNDAAFQHDVTGVGAARAGGVVGVHIEILRQDDRHVAAAAAGHHVGAVSLQPDGLRDGTREQSLIAGSGEIDAPGKHLAYVIDEFDYLHRADHAEPYRHHEHDQRHPEKRRLPGRTQSLPTRAGACFVDYACIRAPLKDRCPAASFLRVDS